jgi:REP element-mobilizing transposase RayT
MAGGAGKLLRSDAGSKQSWGGELWNDGYFARSVGDKVISEIIRRYIKYQQ